MQSVGWRTSFELPYFAARPASLPRTVSSRSVEARLLPRWAQQHWFRRLDPMTCSQLVVVAALAPEVALDVPAAVEPSLALTAKGCWSLKPTFASLPVVLPVQLAIAFLPPGTMMVLLMSKVDLEVSQLSTALKVVLV